MSWNFGVDDAVDVSGRAATVVSASETFVTVRYEDGTEEAFGQDAPELALLRAYAPPAASVPTGQITGDGMPDRLYAVDAACTIYRSAQPTAAEFVAMKARLGLRSVVKLNSAIEGRDHLPDGVEPLEHPWLPLGPVTHEQVMAALADLEAAPKPVLIHCTHGVDRTGMLVALWRVKHGTLPFAAVGEWRAFGRNEKWDGLFDESFERETGYRP